ncbi:rRNA biogenesis protein rrp5 [Thraustotheca clavata]|uniref:rRNA biogenesis protein RRP5 n=1 Tax=Thraustotheca clavata TaxID=74557 RepID=A0A1W0AB06_9STRA|nr:rRNA biogenesis protein rrp5 [Thraustotheca clavata]
MDKGFPRGKKRSEEAPKKRKKPEDGEVLFGKKDKEEATPKKIVKQMKKQDTVQARTNSEKPPSAYTITFKTLKPKAFVFGVIRQINENDLVISLPNNLSGFVALKETSDEVHAKSNGVDLIQLFHVGQFVPCVVLKCSKEEKGKRIELSMRASLVNGNLSAKHIAKGASLYASVVSVEDHGVIMNVGVRGYTGFVPMKDLHLPEGLTECQPGQQFFCAVNTVNEHTQTLNLTTEKATTVKTVTRGDGYTMSTLSLGMLLNIRIEDVLTNGLSVNFLTFFNGTVEYNHMSNPCQKNWASSYSKGMKGRARIIAIDEANKIIALSMAPHIVHLQAPQFTESIGDVIESCAIHRIEGGVGMLMSLAGLTTEDKLSWKDFRPAFAHISRCSDTRVDKLDKMFKIDQIFPGRVVGFSLFDGVVNVTLAPSAINKTVLRLTDLQAGTIIKGKVIAVESWGILVEICEGIRGVVSAAHAPSVALKKTMSKYKPGHGIECRVLKVDVPAKKVHLTLKKGLVSSELPPLTSYEQATPGTLAHGFITKIADFGLVVGFYNGVHGLVPAATLLKAGVEDIAASYTTGQVVKACVARCDPSKMRMTLTFDTSITSTRSKSTNSTGAVVESGSMVDVKVIEIEDGFVRVQTTDGLEGVLQNLHFTDFPRHISPTVAVDDTFTCMVLNQSKEGLLQLTKKPLLLASKSSIPSSFDQVKDGQQVTGFVREIRPFGIFVSFLNNLQALAPVAFLTNRFVSSPEGLFEVGDTVHCFVDKVNAEKQQFTLDFRTDDKFVAADYVNNFFQEQGIAYGTAQPWKDHHVGHTEKAEFVSAKGYGHVCTLSDETTVVVPETSGLDWSENDSVKLRLIDFDYEKKVFFGHASDESLVKAGEKKARKKSSRLALNTNVKATILLARDEYAIVSVNETIGVLQIASFFHPSQTCSVLDVEAGQTHACRVAGYIQQNPFDDLPILVLESEKKKKKQKQPKAEHEHLPKYSSGDLVLGGLVTGRIIGIKEDTMELKIKCSKTAGKVNAFVSIVDVDKNENQHPFDAYSTNSVVTGRIVSMVEKGSNQRKPVSAENPANFRSLNISLKACDQSGEVASRADWSGAGLDILKQEDALIPGVVVETAKDGVMIRLSARVVGFCHALQLSSDVSVLKTFAQNFAIGTHVKCRVISLDEEKKHVDLSCLETPRSTDVGAVILGRVNTNVKALAPPSVMIQLDAHSFGRVCVTEVVDAPATLPLATLEHGAFVHAVVLSNDKHTLELSVKPSASNGPSAYVTLDAATAEKTPAVGDLVQGYVASVTSGGCFVRIHRSRTARVLLRDLSDDYVKEPAKQFPPGTLVAGRVTKVDGDKLELSLKASVVTGNSGSVTLESLSVGQNVKGTISSIQPYGVFIKVENSTLSGLCHISEVTDSKVTSLDSVFTIGDYVKAKVLMIEKRRISLGLKPSYFENDESSSEEESDDEDENVDMENNDEEALEEEQDVDMEAQSDDEDENDNAEEDNDDEEDTNDEDNEQPKTAPFAEFAWDGFSIEKKQDDKEDESENEEEEDVSKAKSKRLKKKAKENEDMYVAYRERALAAGETVPESADDFERLLAVSPLNSFLWIQYMAFHVSMTDITAARDVAVRATTKVSFREAQEKLNVWVAYLNLEHDHGDDESFLRVFNSALRANNPKHMYMKLVELYVRHEQSDDVDSTLKTMQKKFNTSAKVWLRSCEWSMQEGTPDVARKVLQRSMQSLPKHKHLKVLTKFALMQYDYGELEQGRTMFEQIMSNYPKKLDLWNVYLDREVKFGEQASTRLLFERVVSMSLSAKKMKAIFKKYLTYEMDHGTEEGVEHVKQLAAAYVEASAA